MNIKIDLNITLPDALINLINTLSLFLGQASGGVNVATPATPAAKPAKAEKPAPVTAAADPAPAVQAEPEKTAPPVHVTDEMIVAAADTAVVKVGSNPMIIKNAIAARFQKDDGSPATLKTVSAAQRPAMHAFLVMVGQTGDVNGTV